MCGTSHDPRKGLWMLRTKKNSDFCIILKIHEDRVVNLQFFYDCFIEQKCWMIEQQLKFKIEVGLEAA